MRASKRLADLCSRDCRRSRLVGDSFEYEGRRYSVATMDGLRVESVKIETAPTPASAAAFVCKSRGPLMLRYVFSRLLYMLPVVWLVVSVVFLLIHLVPGDPIQQMLGEGAAATDIAAARHAYGLDVPLGKQYVNYWRGILHGDMGKSLRLNQNVGHVIAQAYPVHDGTDAGGADCGAWGCRFPPACARPCVAIVGTIAAQLRLAAGTVVSQLRAGADSRFCFSRFELGWLPVSGSGSPAHLILPAITMGGALAAILTRMVRTSMLEELGQDYIRTARAKGLPERTVVYRHALRNAMIPILTVVGLQFGALLAGAIVTETIFSWPGIGRLTITAISNRDYYLVQGCILMIGLTYVLVNFLDRFAVLGLQSTDPAVELAFARTPTGDTRT